MTIRHAPITDQPAIQPTMTVIIAQVGMGGMPRTPGLRISPEDDGKGRLTASRDGY